MYLYQGIIISKYFINLGIKEIKIVYETNSLMQSNVILMPRYLPSVSAKNTI